MRHPYLLVVVDVDNRLAPLASRNLALEHDIDLTVGPTLHLRDVEVRHDEAHKASGTPDVTTLAAKVTTLKKVNQHILLQDVGARSGLPSG